MILQLPSAEYSITMPRLATLTVWLPSLWKVTNLPSSSVYDQFVAKAGAMDVATKRATEETRPIVVVIAEYICLTSLQSII